jgi:type III secretion system needle length determinant
VDGGTGDPQETKGASEQAAAQQGSQQLGDAILRSLNLMHQPVQGQPGQPAGPSAEQLSKAVEAVADRVLVSTPESGRQEVRIFLRDSVLPGTEVTITRHGGGVQIEFNTSSNTSHMLINQNKDGLENQLRQSLGEDVKVNLSFQDREQNEGRSRGEYVPQDES